MPKRSDISMKAFHTSRNWADLWERFATSVHPKTGMLKYRNISQFMHDLKLPQNQREFVMWFLGPKGVEPKHDSWRFVEPQGWLERRESGAWFSDKALKEATKAIRAQSNALDALKEAGNGITIRFMARVEGLAKKLDEAFGGELFVEGLPFEANLKRTEKYFQLQKQLLGMLGQAQSLYALAHGINFSDMSGYGQLLAAIGTAAQSQSAMAQNRTAKAMEALLEMRLEKSATYGMPLLEGEVEVIQANLKDDGKKRGVQ